MINLLSALLILFIVTTIHELAHYFTAIYLRVQVTHCAIFLPIQNKNLLKLSIFSIGFYPLGGYTRIRQDKFYSIKKLMAITAAGVIANTITGLIFFSLSYWGGSGWGKLAIVSFILVVFNILPFIPGTDGYQYFRFYKLLRSGKSIVSLERFKNNMQKL